MKTFFAINPAHYEVNTYNRQLAIECKLFLMNFIKLYNICFYTVY